MYRPTMSSSFSTNLGSRETLKPRTRCGFKPLARQCRETLAALTPSVAAILRVLQCVAASGLLCVVSSTRRATSTFTGGAPRGRSTSHALTRIALAPARDLGSANIKLHGNDLVLLPLRRHENNLRTQG